MPIIPSQHPLQRRSFLHATGKLAAAAVLPATLLPQTSARQGQHEQNYDVSTNERLMRDHGILKRVLVIYDEVIRRIDANLDFPPQTLIDSAQIVRKFIEDYHQKTSLSPLLRRDSQYCLDIHSSWHILPHRGVLGPPVLPSSLRGSNPSLGCCNHNYIEFSQAGGTYELILT